MTTPNNKQAGGASVTPDEAQKPKDSKPLPRCLERMPKKHRKSVFTDEQELLQALIDIHLGEDIELDPMYFKGAFYRNGINRPKHTFDLMPRDLFVEEGNAENLPFPDSSFNNMILDPLFLFEKRNRTQNFYTATTMGILNGFEDLERHYRAILKEAHRLLRPKGKLIFKCQDYTDSKTTMTHCYVYSWATELGFYAKDLAILVKPNKVYNGNTTQRHLRKIHTYFWVFERQTEVTDLVSEDVEPTQTVTNPPHPAPSNNALDKPKELSDDK